MFTSGSLIKFIQQLIDEDGIVKDSAVRHLLHFEGIRTLYLFNLYVCTVDKSFLYYTQVTLF